MERKQAYRSDHVKHTVDHCDPCRIGRGSQEGKMHKCIQSVKYDHKKDRANNIKV